MVERNLQPIESTKAGPLVLLQRGQKLLRFSLREMLIVTAVLGVLIAANYRSYDVSHPSGPRIHGRGFPIMWAIFEVPLEDPDRLIGDHNRHKVILNAALCLFLAFFSVVLLRGLPKWIRNSFAPARNPGFVLLYFFGGYCLLAGIGGSFGSHNLLQLVVSIGILALGVVAIGLARRPFDQLNRVATILWGIVATTAILVACIFIDPISLPLSRRDVPGVIIVSMVLLGLFALLWISVRKPAVTRDTMLTHHLGRTT